MLRSILLCGAVLLLSACATSGFNSPLLRAGHQADFILIDKSDKQLTLFEKGKVLKTYRILSFGADPVGHKQQEGDERTPEGLYFISRKNPSQKFHYFLNFSYPNDEDRRRAKARGVKPGGNVGIHGDKGGWEGFVDRQKTDWTDGCVTVRNHEVEEIYALTPVGTMIEIRP